MPHIANSSTVHSVAMGTPTTLQFTVRQNAGWSQDRAFTEPSHCRLRVWPLFFMMQVLGGTAPFAVAATADNAVVLPAASIVVTRTADDAVFNVTVTALVRRIP
mgnify:CR=1 FL=1